jgi:hypothetical protein
MLTNERQLRNLPTWAAYFADLFPSRLRKKIGVAGFVLALSKGFQAIEDNIYDVYMSTTLDRATGSVLDYYGRAFGAGPQLNLSDDLYRKLIYASAAARRMSGAPEQVRGWWLNATGATVVEVEDLPLGEVAVYFWREEYLPIEFSRRLAALFRQVSPGSATAIYECRHDHLCCDGRTTFPLPLGLGQGVLARRL